MPGEGDVTSAARRECGWKETMKESKVFDTEENSRPIPAEGSVPTVSRVIVRNSLANLAPRERITHRVGTHAHQYHGVAVSPCGSRMITANGDNTARLWDIASAQCLMVFEGHTGEVRRAAFMNDGIRAVTSADDGTVRLWDCAAGACVAVLKGHTGKVVALAVSPDDGYIVSSGDEGVLRTWSLPTGRCTHFEERGAGFVTKILITGDGGTLLTLDSRHDLHRWSFPRIGDPHRINGHVFRSYKDFTVTGDDEVVASGWYGLDGFDTRNGYWRRHLSFDPREPHLVTLTPDGARFVVCCAVSNVILVVDSETGAIERELIGHGGAVTGMALCPDGNTLCTVSLDCTCRIWDISRGVCVHTIRPARTVRRLFFLTGGKSLGTFDSGGSAKTWDLADGSHRMSIRDVSSVAFLSLPNLVATGHRNGELRLWDLDNGNGEPGAVIKAQRESVTGLMPLRSGTLLATCGFDGMRLWDVEKRDCVKTYPTLTLAETLAVDEDMERIAVGCRRENSIHLHDLQSGNRLASFTGHNWPITFEKPDAIRGLHFVGHGKGLVSCGRDGRVILWDVSACAAVRSMEEPSCEILCMAVENDGRHVVIGTEKGAVERWDLESGHRQVCSRPGGRPVTALALSPDESRLFVSYTDGTVRIIDRESTTLACILWNVDDGFLWSIPSDGTAPDGWVWTNCDDLLHVVEEDSDGKVLGAVPLNDDRRKAYIQTRNNAAMLQARLKGLHEYTRMAGLYIRAIADRRNEAGTLPNPMLPKGDGHA